MSTAIENLQNALNEKDDMKTRSVLDELYGLIGNKGKITPGAKGLVSSDQQVHNDLEQTLQALQSALYGDTTPGVGQGEGKGGNPYSTNPGALGGDPSNPNGPDDTDDNPFGTPTTPLGGVPDYGGGTDDTDDNPHGTPTESQTFDGSDHYHEEGGENGGDGDGGDGGGGGKPIVLDLDGDGVELVALEDSTAFYDINGDGYRERMAWASADAGFLAYDKDSDGVISAHDELSFVSYVEGAQTDLEGLAHFDTNGNGELDPGDAEWSKFRVWQDLDQDGESDPGELRTLAEAGIASISLTSDGVEQTVAGNTVFGEGMLLAGAGIIAFNQRHRNLPAVCRLQRRHLISQAGEVDVDAAGFRVFAADGYFGRGRMDDLAFHGVESEVFRCNANARAGQEVAGAAV